MSFTCWSFDGNAGLTKVLLRLGSGGGEFESWSGIMNLLYITSSFKSFHTCKLLLELAEDK